VVSARSSPLLSVTATQPPDIYTLFPTRRSSDLVTTAMSQHKPPVMSSSEVNSRSQCETPSFEGINSITDGATVLIETESCPAIRSEEHTSELQSRFDIVCRLLLEKKKTRTE